MDTGKVTRVEVVGDGGRLLTTYARATVELQDDDQTLKVFLTALTTEEVEAARRAHSTGLGALLTAQETRGLT